MSTYDEMTKEELSTLKTALTEEYETYQKQGFLLTWLEQTSCQPA